MVRAIWRVLFHFWDKIHFHSWTGQVLKKIPKWRSCRWEFLLAYDCSDCHGSTGLGACVWKDWIKIKGHLEEWRPMFAIDLRTRAESLWVFRAIQQRSQACRTGERRQERKRWWSSLKDNVLFFASRGVSQKTNDSKKSWKFSQRGHIPNSEWPTLSSRESGVEMLWREEATFRNEGWGRQRRVTYDDISPPLHASNGCGEGRRTILLHAVTDAMAKESPLRSPWFLKLRAKFEQRSEVPTNCSLARDERKPVSGLRA